MKTKKVRTPAAPAPPPPAPPEHLSARAKDLWRGVAGVRVKAPERLAMLQSALEALDRADAARETIALEGMTATTGRTGVAHAHPLLRVEKEARQQFVSAWQALRLHEEARQLGPRW